MTVSCKTFHHHICPKCWHIWSHDGASLAKNDAEAHRCPSCKEGYHWMTLESDEAVRCAAAKDPFPESYGPMEKLIAELAGMLDPH